jgi:hypothetical protein
MKTQELTWESYQNHTTRLRARLPIAPEKFDSTADCTVAELCVDLAEACEKAREARARTLEVIADVVKVKKGFAFALAGDPLVAVSIIARRMELDGTATIALQSADGSRRIARVLAGEISGGELLVRSADAEGKTISAVTPDCFKFRALTYQGEKEINIRDSALPEEMLSAGAPLHYVVRQSFAFAAAVGGEALDTGKPASVEVVTAHRILAWLTQWASYPSPNLSPLFKQVNALRALYALPGSNGIPIYAVPDYLPTYYSTIAKGQLALAKNYELDDKFDHVEETTLQQLGQLVDVWIGRDTVSINEISDEITAAQQALRVSNEAIEKASSLLEEQQFEAQWKKIELDATIEKQKLLDILKMTAEIVVAVIQIGIACATLGATGLPSLTNIGGSPLPGGSLGTKAIRVLSDVYSLPVTLVQDFFAIDKKVRKSIVDSFLKGMLKLKDVSTELLHLDFRTDVSSEVKEVLGQVGQWVGTAAAASDPAEAKAVWEAFEAEAVDQLALITNDPDASHPVKEAAASLTTAIKKTAIYGRLLAEQQAVRMQRFRELGTLLLRQNAVRDQQQVLSTLKNSTEEKELRTRLREIRSAKQEDIRRAFFLAARSFRAAYFYDRLLFPTLRASAPPTSLDEMQNAFNDIRAAEALPYNEPNHFTVGKELAKDAVDALKQMGSVVWEVLPDDASFADYEAIRLKTMKIHLEGLSAGAFETITIRALTSPNLQDRSNSAKYQFTRSPYDVLVKYGKDESTPNFGGNPRVPLFTRWKIEIADKIGKVARDGITGVTMTYEGVSRSASA